MLIVHWLKYQTVSVNVNFTVLLHTYMHHMLYQISAISIVVHKL